MFTSLSREQIITKELISEGIYIFNDTINDAVITWITYTYTELEEVL